MNEAVGDHPSTRDVALRLVAGDTWTSMAHVAGLGYLDSPRPPDGECIAAIAHLSDTHICDAESPARLEYLDAHGHPGAPYRSVLGDIGTYRPHEILTVPVAIAALTAVNRLGGGPVTRRPFDCAVFTGDLIDNAQENEIDWFTTLLAGGPVRAASGDSEIGWWVGAPQVAWNASYWHPDGHTTGRRDVWLDKHGFPRIDGLTTAARATVICGGLALPRVLVHGNHDRLLQGTVAVDDELQGLATGRRRALDLGPESTALAILEATPRVGPARYPLTDRTPFEVVPADRARQLVGHDTLQRRLGPMGPGSGIVHHQLSAAHDVVVAPGIRLIALDTVNPHGGWEGSLDRDQMSWLRRRLGEITESYLIVASHHPSWCLVNGFRPDGAAPRVLADEVLRTLLDEPRVICWLSGHVHHHSVTTHRHNERLLPEITSASLIDWPQQWRTLEIIRESSGMLALVSTAVDHAGVVSPELSASDDPLHLAGLSRVIAHHVPDIRRLIERRRVRADPPHECNVVVRIADPLLR